MADYHSPTVVRPSIPLAAITSLELALLSQIFEHESDGDAVYFFSSDGPSDTVWLDIADLKVMLDEEPMPSGLVVEMIRAKLAEVTPDEAEPELDLSDLGEAAILQQIVRRCDLLDHVVVTSAWTCTKMRPDGWGGGVTVVTADHILFSSTNEIEGLLLDRAEYGDLGCAPGHGKHSILTLDEAEVRSMVTDLQQAYVESDLTGVTVGDDHIRQACIDLIPTLDLDEQLRGFEFSAAMAAIRIGRTATA